MLLSIVVPTYNVEKYIANCLESLVKQNIAFDTYEIIIINDGSTDESARLAEIYSDTYSNIHVIHQKNAGLSAARNAGISVAKGKYIYFIDSDDYIATNTLQLVLDTLETYDLDMLGLDIIETAALDITASKNASELTIKDAIVSDGITYIANNNYLNNAWWYVIRLEFLKESQLVFPEGRLVEDANFTAKLIVAAKKFGWLPLDFYRYFMRPNSIMRRKNVSHVKRLVGDYAKNVFEFEAQLKQLRSKNSNPELERCIQRIETRKNSFVFFMLVKSLRYGLPKKELEKTISEFKKTDSYPIRNFIGEDYNNLSYKILVPILNNEKIYFILRKLFSFIP